MLEVSHASLTIERPEGGLPVIDDVSFQAEDGECVVLVGPSGCGKTTLLRAIDGLRKVDGRIQVDGEPITEPSPSCAMVFQEFNLFPWRTVSQNVSFGLEMLGLEKDEIRRRVAHFLALVQLDGFEDAYPHEISGGMKQRAGLARALSTGARHLLMDEPFGALDPQVRQLMQESLLEIRTTDRRTIVFVTHDVDEALILGDRVIVLTARPARIRDVVAVEFPYPRDVDALRAQPDFARLRRRIWEELKKELESTGGTAA